MAKGNRRAFVTGASAALAATAAATPASAPIRSRNCRRSTPLEREIGIRESRRLQTYAMQSISTSEFPGMPPAAAMVVLTPGSSPKRPRKTSFIAV